MDWIPYAFAAAGVLIAAGMCAGWQMRGLADRWEREETQQGKESPTNLPSPQQIVILLHQDWLDRQN